MSSPSLLDILHRGLVARLERDGRALTDADALTVHARTLLVTLAPDLPPEEHADVLRNVVDRMLGWGPLTPFLRDPAVTEIMVNGSQSLYIERDGVLERVADVTVREDELLAMIQRMAGMVGRRIDAASPLVDARLPDGSRVNAIIPPLSLVGPVLTIRRFPPQPLTLDALVTRGTCTDAMAAYLRDAVTAKRNIVISGGTGSGKTTTLNALASIIPVTERLITIEDAAEIRLTHPHLVSLESRPPNLEGKGEVPVRMLVKNALRMRPDRIIVGEIRGGEALDMLQAMNTGHQGSLTTVHANAPLEALLRIETMALMADVELPLAAIRQQVTQALHVIVQQERLPDGRRAIVAIAELTRTRPSDGAPYRLVPRFRYDRERGTVSARSKRQVSSLRVREAISPATMMQDDGIATSRADALLAMTPE